MTVQDHHSARMPTRSSFTPGFFLAYLVVPATPTDRTINLPYLGCIADGSGIEKQLEKIAEWRKHEDEACRKQT
jgi:hypothetical protein